MTTTTLPLDPHTRAALRALSACASTADHRRSLCGIWFSDRHAWATDSHVLSRVELPIGVTVDTPALVPAATLRAVLNRAPKRADVTLTLGEVASVHVERADLLTAVADTTSIALLEDTWPRHAPDLWPDTLPMTDDGHRPVVQIHHLQRLAALAGTIAGASSDALRLFYAGGLKPVVVANAAGDVVGLAMPMRSDGTDQQLVDVQTQAAEVAA